ncbi:hypothetical protein PgNI_11085 [Pyricularia grisea]|uniref:Uncharacterized protein n=1 Tax=Pyricularia grisea TaxID=148305 RepID=A0A6P8AZW9_PYRGI|nr:hypothetical protein PgNI_11085 [Pyricularia grisea]TLD07867.1 hypothetical protein PgNI_11085 [Pyricularia grisea]
MKVILNAAYNVFFHPLSKFPGCKLHAATRFVKDVKLLRGTFSESAKDLHLKYGEIVRVAPNELSYIDPRFYSDVLQISGEGEMKKEFFGVAQKAQSSPVPNKSHDGGSTVESMTIMSKKDDHDRFRRLFQPAFTNVALKAQHPLIASHADLVVARLTESHAAGDNINVTELATYYSVDMMSELVFGHSLGLLDGNPQYVSWVHAMLSGLRWVVLTAVLMQVPLLGSLLHALATGPMKGIVGAHYRLASELVDRRLDQKPEQAGKPDVWSFVIGRQQQSEKRGKGVKGLTRDDMHVAASMLMIVGTETSATVLCGVMYYLGQKANRHVHDKLALEIRSTIRHSEEVHNDPGLLVRLPYLNAVLQEGLRMYMPGGITPRVVPEGGATICGEYVPAGTRVAYHSPAAFNSPINFTRAGEFLPERWLNPDDPEFAGDRRQVVQPFSVGPRSCTGKDLAWAELRMFVAKVIWHFDVVVCPESEDWIVGQKTYISYQKGPMMCKFTPVAARGSGTSSVLS